MTTRTGANPRRTKRLVRISAVLFAAGALVLAGAAAMASPVAADPGNGQGQGQEQAVENQAQGQDNGSSGQDKVWVCHYVEGKGETKAGYNLIEIAKAAEATHLGHGDKSASGPDATCPGGGVDDKKAFVCHYTPVGAEVKTKVEILEVGTSAVAAHVEHGDTVTTSATGPCAPVPVMKDICHLNTAGTAFVKESVTEAQFATLVTQTGYEAVLANGTCRTLGGGSATTVVTPPAAAVTPEAAAVTAVEPATAAVPLPAKVAKPTAATMPGKVPAGDGSSKADFAPLLGLTAAAGMVAAVSATRLRKLPTR